jgi:hypothetical protein
MAKRKIQSSRSRPGVSLLALAGLAVVGVLVAGYVWSRPASSPATAPASQSTSIQSGKSQIDLGRVPFNQQVEARFELVNSGASTVRFTGPPQVTTLEGC